METIVALKYRKVDQFGHNRNSLALIADTAAINFSRGALDEELWFQEYVEIQKNEKFGLTKLLLFFKF
jgi:hypothetical protein